MHQMKQTRKTRETDHRRPEILFPVDYETIPGTVILNEVKNLRAVWGEILRFLRSLRMTGIVSLSAPKGMNPPISASSHPPIPALYLCIILLIGCSGEKSTGPPGPTGPVVPETSGGKVYVANSWPFRSAVQQAGGTLSVIDIETQRVVGTIPVGEVPFDVIPSKDERRLYVVNRGLESHPDMHPGASKIWVIDRETGERIVEIPLPKNPGQIRLSPEGDRAYIIVTRNVDRDTPRGIAVVDLTSYQVTGIIPLEGFPYGLAISSDGTRLCATNLGFVSPTGDETHFTTLGVVDVGTFSLEEVEVNWPAYGICLSSDDRLAYITKPFEDLVDVIDLERGERIQQIRVGHAPQRIVSSPDGTRLYVANARSNDVSVVDTETREVIATVEAGPYPEGILATSDGQYIYVTNRNPGSMWQGIESPEGSVTVIDAENLSVLATIPVEEEPIGMCAVLE